MRERAGRCRADDKLRAGWVPALRANRALARGVKPRLPEPTANSAEEGSWIGLDHEYLEVRAMSLSIHLWINRLVPSSRQVTIASKEWISQCPPCDAAAPLSQHLKLSVSLNSGPRDQIDSDPILEHNKSEVCVRCPRCPPRGCRAASRAKPSSATSCLHGDSNA